MLRTLLFKIPPNWSTLVFLIYFCMCLIYTAQDNYLEMLSVTGEHVANRRCQRKSRKQQPYSRTIITRSQCSASQGFFERLPSEVFDLILDHLTGEHRWSWLDVKTNIIITLGYKILIYGLSKSIWHYPLGVKGHSRTLVCRT